VNVQRITLAQAIDYEVASSSWVGYVSWGWLQDVVGAWFARRARRKFARYIAVRNFTLQRQA
jgi:hypothetical protein